MQTGLKGPEGPRRTDVAEGRLQLAAGVRRRTAYVYVQDLLTGAVVELLPDGTESGADEEVKRLLLARGARTVEQRRGLAADLTAGSADVVLAVDVAPARLEAVVAEARRLLKGEGVLVLGCESRDRPGAKSGVSYYDLLDRLAGSFAAVTMVGQAPFGGAALVEYGVKEVEALVDATLVPKGERVEWYLAIAASTRRSGGAYALVQAPFTDVVPATSFAPAPGTAPAAAAAAAPAAAPAPAAPASVPASPRPAARAEAAPAEARELHERLQQRERALVEFQDAAVRHARELAAVEAQLRERDAYIFELERDARNAGDLREQLRRAEVRTQGALERERQARLHLAEVEGRFLATRGGAPVAAPSAAPVVVAPSSVPLEGEDALRQRVAELEAECVRLRQKEEEARSDSWKHLKARGEAEAQVREMRDDTVRKLKDARKLASLDLTRAMEEATKKAVTLKDELARSEKERKELRAELNALRGGAPVAAPAEAAPAPAAPSATTGDESAAALEAERTRAGQLAEAVARLEAELVEARRQLAPAPAPATAAPDHGDGRVGDLERELERRAAQVERTAAAAAHERARAERLLADERRATAERNEARARLAEVEARIGVLGLDLERAQRERVAAEARLREERDSTVARLERELGGERDRARNLGTALAAAERRLADALESADRVRARLGGLETLVDEESRRLATLEEALSRARG